MAQPSRIERRSFDPKTMDRNWDRSNDEYLSILIRQREEEEAAAGSKLSPGDSHRGFLITIIRAISGKIGAAGG